ncbi:hypothetical protein FISHEDRAFT_55874 [Fistulina hepatica ATCC 64428]|uniref:Uncharacterized protein n=1 Tax=Fistulina hepatica ATCC 64428 TaxID=1128425 RepID=A0A0D7ALP6_9AGAR|nr:hypothetical protein FISHEDRAFT_55874 [Fistulina hepatica ATCC 64428]
MNSKAVKRKHHGSASGSDADDDSLDDSSKKTKKKKKKTEAPKENKTLPANSQVNDQIGLLRTRWACPLPESQCASDYCFIAPEKASHYHLNFAQLEAWAQAIAAA